MRCERSRVRFFSVWSRDRLRFSAECPDLVRQPMPRSSKAKIFPDRRVFPWQSAHMRDEGVSGGGIPVLLLLCVVTTFAAPVMVRAADGASGPQQTLRLPPAEGNPRNSEGDFITLKDGRVMFAYSRFSGGAGDHDRAVIAARFSADGGCTWTEDDVEIAVNPSGWNAMSVSLLRLQDGRVALFYLRKNSLADCRPMMQTTSDEGRTWTEPVVCIPDPAAYYVMNNDRVVQLDSGRIVLPVALHENIGNGKLDMQGRVMCWLSDDGGRSWKRSRSMLTAFSENGKRLIAQEPGVVQLKDGRVMMFVRSNAGCQLLSFSEDDGDTWSTLIPSEIISPVSPASIERIPATGDLLLVWNDHDGIRAELRGKRTPFRAAVSSDDGRTWNHLKTIADNPHGWYCYTAIHFVEDHVLLGHCAGDRRENNGLAETWVTRFPVDWLYQQEQ